MGQRLTTVPQCQRHDVSQREQEVPLVITIITRDRLQQSCSVYHWSCSLLCCLMHAWEDFRWWKPVQYCMTVMMNEHVLSSGCCSQRGLRRKPLASNPKPASFAPRYVIVLILQKLTKSGQRSLHEVVCHILSDSIVKIPRAPWSLL